MTIAIKENDARPYLEASDDFIQSHIDSHLPPTEEVIEEQEEKQEYMNSSDPTEADTDGDGIPDEDEMPGQHWQIEAEPPEVEYIKTKKSDGKLYIQVKVTDNVEVYKLKLNVEGFDPKYFHGDGSKTEIFSTTKDPGLLDFTNSLFSGFDVKLKVFDAAQNGAKGDAHIDSVAEEIGKTIVGALEEIRKKVEDFKKRAANLIKQKISDIARVVIKPLTQGLGDWIRGVVNELLNLFKELDKFEKMNGTESVESVKKAAIAFYLSLIGMQEKAEACRRGMQRGANLAAPFAEYISPYGVAGTIMKVLGENIEELGSFFEKIRSGVSGGIGKLVAWIMEKLWGATGSLASAIGITGREGDEDIDLPSFTALKNFAGSSDWIDEGGILYAIFDNLEITDTTTSESTQLLANDDSSEEWGEKFTNTALIILGVLSITILSAEFLHRAIKTGSYMMDALTSIGMEFVGLLATIASTQLTGAKEVVATVFGATWTSFWYSVSIDDYLQLVKDWPVGTILTAIGTGEVVYSFYGIAHLYNA